VSREWRAVQGLLKKRATEALARIRRSDHSPPGPRRPPS
jgi:hypothetical protein